MNLERNRRRSVHPDINHDGRRNELDPDSDSGGTADGCEDGNKQWPFPEAYIETSNFRSFG